MEKLLASKVGAGYFQFGLRVAISGDQFLVRAPGWAPAGEDASGKAYLFTYQESAAKSAETIGLVPFVGSGAVRFGNNVAIDGAAYMFGLPRSDESADGGGAVYAYGDPTVGTATAEEILLSGIGQSEVYPYPFSGQTNVTLALDSPLHVTVRLFDLMGREPGIVSDRQIGAGSE